MREELLNPSIDNKKFKLLLPVIQEIYWLHESGSNYDAQLKNVSRLAGRIVDVPMVLYAFGSCNAESFARRLLINWQNIPSDLSKDEMLNLVEAIFNARGEPTNVEYWLKCLEVNTGDAKISDLIFWPDLYQGGKYIDKLLTPEEILNIALENGGRSA